MVSMTTKKKALFFFAKFFAIFWIGEIVLPAMPLASIEKWIAGMQAELLGLQAAGNTLLIGNYEFVINSYCTGAVSSIILLALIFSLKQPGIKTKLAMWGAGTIVLFIANIARIYAVLWSGLAIGPEIAETVHIASWFGVSAIVIWVWYVLTKKIAKISNFRELV